ncbi:MAG: glycoside hydrolase family 3 C-terminal domain-containing protein [Lachnospiraceae bacterium]|nr:glycoside hydrolase family 3 C-terminal domain-containing protein [Candidatus Equihabitans merdae]
MSKNIMDIQVSDLTLDEKVDLVRGAGAWHTDDLKGKIPALRMHDGPHGLRKQDEGVTFVNDSYPATCFPTASGWACSFDRDMATLMADAIAEEALVEDVSIVLGPGINMKRSPLCGRNFEYISEDPFLAGSLGTAFINAIQKRGVGVSLKHFAANSQETHRQVANSQIDDRALHEIYLAAFEKCVREASPSTLMGSYNRLNGTHACANKALMTKILREKWGFKGTLISDWSACIDPPACVEAGMDLEMPRSGKEHREQLKEAVLSGAIPEEALDRAAGNVLNLVKTYAIECRKEKYPSPIANAEDKAAAKDAMLKRHYRLAMMLACESAVLLKNDGCLPLKKDQKIAVIGDLAKKMRYQGGGSSHINAAYTSEAYVELEKAGYSVTYAQGYDAKAKNVSQDLIDQAVAVALDADLILFFGGLTDLAEGEGYDRKTMDIPENQLRLMDALTALDKPIVMTAFGGSPFSLPFFDKLNGLLHMYLSGEAVGEACVRLLSGQVNPSGKLAETFPYKAEDTPCYGTFGTESDDVEYRESMFVGYRYYDTYGVPVQFPFGYGLSYTSFEYSNLKVENALYSGGELTVTLDVTNTGDIYGKEAVQLYVENPPCAYRRPKKELRAFTKVALAPGQTKTVTMTLNERSFSIYDDERGDFIMPGGNYRLVAAASSVDEGISTGVKVEGVLYDKVENFAMDAAGFKAIYKRPLSHFDDIKPGQYDMSTSLSKLSKSSFLGKMVLSYAEKEVMKTMPGVAKDDPEALLSLEMIRYGTLDCMASQSNGALPYSLAKAIVDSANGRHMSAFKNLLACLKK